MTVLQRDVRGLQQAVAELYAKTSRSEGPSGSGVESVKAFGAVGNGTTDDAAAIQRALNALAGTGIKLWFPEGTYVVGSPIIVPSQSFMYAVPGTATLLGTMTPTGVQTQAILLWQDTPAGTTTLATNSVAGTSTLSLTSNVGGTVVKGAMIGISSTALRSQVYTVESITGNGPYTVTTDRIVRDAYTAPGLVTVLTQPADIVVDGLNFSGTATRFIEALTSRDCVIRNSVMTATALAAPADLVASFDVGGFRNTFEAITVVLNGAAVTAGGLALESQESSTIVGCFVTGASAANNSAYSVYDAFDCVLRDNQDDASFIGVLVTSDGNNIGSDGTRIIGHVGNRSSSAAIYVSKGSSDTVIEAPSLLGVVGNAVLTDPQTTGVLLLGGEIANVAASTNIELVVADGATGIKAVGVTFVGNSTVGFAAAMNGAGDLQLSACTFKGNFATLLTYGATANLDTSAVTIAATVSATLVSATGGVGHHRGWDFTGPGGGLNLVQVTGGRHDFDSGQFVVTNAGSLFAATGGTLTLERIVATCPGGAAVVTATGGTVRQGFGLDFSGYATAYLNAGGGFTNRFTQVLAGAATTVVAWPDLKSTDNVQLQVQSKNAGTLEGPYGITPNPGTGFTITPLGTTPALDVSTLQVLID